VEESIPRRRSADRHLTLIEMLVIVAVLVAVVAMAVWFVFFSAQGIGPSTV
jgi:Tfp pilus assembly protein FimT